MASPLPSLGFGVVFGLALAAPPGPMNAIIAEESVVRGWLAGFTAGLGAMTADVCFFVLSVLGAVTVVGSVPRLRAAMVGVGGLLMVYFAYGAARDAVTGHRWEGEAAGRGFVKAFALALTNPYQIVFWLSVGVGLLQPGTVDLLSHVPYVGGRLAGTFVVRTGSPALLVGFFAGIVAWIVGFPASLVLAGRRVDRFAPAVAALSAMVLLAFGAWFLVRAASALV